MKRNGNEMAELKPDGDSSGTFKGHRWECRPSCNWSRRGVAAVLTFWTGAFVRIGTYKGLGMMLPALQDQFATKTWVFGFIASLIAAAIGISGLCAGGLARLIRPGAVIFVCGAMVTGAFVACAFATSPLQMAWILTLLAGTGIGVPAVVRKTVIARSFGGNFATAMCIGRTGTAIGLLVIPPLIQVFLETYGWRATMLLLGAIFFHNTACGALLLATRVQQEESYQQLPTADGEPEPGHRSNLSSRCIASWSNGIKILDLSLLTSGRYWALAVLHCHTSLAYLIWTIYFTSMAQSKGFSLRDVSHFITFAGAGSLIAKVCQGPIIDSGIVPHYGLIGTTLAVVSATLCATPWLNSYWLMMASASVILIGDGVLVCMNDVLQRKILGVDLLASCYGWIGLQNAVLNICIGFFPGWIYDLWGSYNATFIAIGCLQGLALIPLILLRYIHGRE